MPRSGTALLRMVMLTAAGAVVISACDAGVLPRMGGGPAAGPAPEPTIAAQTSSQASRPTIAGKSAP